MKLGFRKPSLKKRLRARTSVKRQMTQRQNIKMPKGKGWLRNPKRSARNKVYNLTSFDLFKVIKKLFK